MAKPLPVCNRVRELREAAGLTQAQLGQAVGVTRQTIAAIEQRRYSPSLVSAFRIAREFDVDINVVFAWAD